MRVLLFINLIFSVISLNVYASDQSASKATVKTDTPKEANPPKKATNKKCVGKFLNPITDLAWQNMLPITIGSRKIAGGDHEDPYKPTKTFTLCNKIPCMVASYWEPASIIEITRTPFCMMSLGGVKLFDTKKGRGMQEIDQNNNKHAFYQTHYYVYPIMHLMKLMKNTKHCVSNSKFDIAYLSEVDPTYRKELLALITHPMIFLYNSTPGMLACGADCVRATKKRKFGLDILHWCNGCNGLLFPLTGYIMHHIGGLRSAELLAHRQLYRWARLKILRRTTGDEAICGSVALSKMPKGKRYFPKGQYKLQVVYPKTQTQKLADQPTVPLEKIKDEHFKDSAKSGNASVVLGQSALLREAGFEFPVNGEDYVFVVWRRKTCCISPPKIKKPKQK